MSWQTIESIAAAVILTLSLGCIPLVLLRHKEPASATAWILTLIFLPVVGVILFWFLGRDRIRRPARAKASSDFTVRDRMLALSSMPRRLEWDPSDREAPFDQHGVMRLAAKVGRRNITGSNRVDLLVGAPTTYEAQLQAIAAARDHVHLEYYIVRDDEQGRRFLDALVEAARRGVYVRLLCDGFGSRQLGKRFFRPLLEAGGYVAQFLPIDPIRAAWTLNMRNHRKLMVVDGHIAFTGGINIGQQFLQWRDVHLRIEGPAALQLQAIFVEDWYFATRWDLTDAAFFPVCTPVGSSVLQIVDSGPDTRIESIHRLYFAAIAAARRRVLVTTPYFVPDRALLVALQTAAMRGVEVRLVVPKHSNHRVTYHAGRSFYEELLSAGVQIHEYALGMLHTKTIIVDGEFATVGSANLDLRSFRLNFELIAVLWDQQTVRQLEAVFAEDLTHTELQRLEDWEGRPWTMRFKEGVGRLCSPLL